MVHRSFSYEGDRGRVQIRYKIKRNAQTPLMLPEKIEMPWHYFYGLHHAGNFQCMNYYILKYP
jgi:hypothetical protein